ncbi:MAG: DUF929 domain-containing protein, partial [Thermoplasmata archaeon]|nr:DUF929 domain-containing protein [Thermoplasmata archaeon]
SGKGFKTDDAPGGSRWSIARVGMIVVPMLGVWALLAFVFPSPIGTYVTAVSVVFFLLIAAAVLSFVLLREAEKWNRTLRTSLVIGVVLGFVVSGALGIAAISQGCPTLSANTSSEPNGWEKTSNSEWSVNGGAVFFFYGSAACPYCSASSWAMATALQRFGTLTGTYTDHSSSTDTFPNTPEVVLAGASLQSQYVALLVDESTGDSSITFPSIGQCTEQTYVSVYDANGIPFVVIGGTYVHSGSLVDPSQLQGLSAAQVQQQISSQSGAAWNAISPQAYLMEAMFVKLNHGQPTSVATDPNVASALASLN